MLERLEQCSKNSLSISNISSHITHPKDFAINDFAFAIESVLLRHSPTIIFWPIILL